MKMTLRLKTLLVLGLMTTSQAFAYKIGKYECTTDAGWKKYTVEITEMNLSGNKMPFVHYVSESLEMRGIATVITSRDRNQTTESLSLEKIDLISFIGDGTEPEFCKAL